ncbi:MAG TPA: acylphosphatase [Burkholderiales bacterium]|nr:acylphosphatase [Burkholderiales bacterium]
MPVTKRLHLSGYVQGVGFRMYMMRKARELGVAGWVRNRLDGQVEAVVHGSAEAVDALIAWARRGPPGARVQEVRVTDAEGEFAGFETRPTE